MNILKQSDQNQNQIVVFTLDEPRCSLYLSVVERVVQVVEITLLPKAPEIVLGVINVQGRIIPVIDIRLRFGLPAREMQIDDQFIIARTPRRTMALAVDAVSDVLELENSEIVSAEQAIPFAEHIQGVAKTRDDIILIYDLDRFLSLDEERLLDEALYGGTE